MDRVLIDSTYTGETIEIGGPDILSYRQVTDTIIRTYGRRRIKVRVPTSMMRAALPFLKIALASPADHACPAGHAEHRQCVGAQVRGSQLRLSGPPLEGNIDYILDMGWKEALSISLGLRPARR